MLHNFETYFILIFLKPFFVVVNGDGESYKHKKMISTMLILILRGLSHYKSRSLIYFVYFFFLFARQPHNFCRYQHFETLVSLIRTTFQFLTVRLVGGWVCVCGITTYKVITRQRSAVRRPFHGVFALVLVSVLNYFKCSAVLSKTLHLRAFSVQVALAEPLLNACASLRGITKTVSVVVPVTKSWRNVLRPCVWSSCLLIVDTGCLTCRLEK